MPNTPTTLERASFGGQKGATINLKFNSMASYAVGVSCTVGGTMQGTITQLLPNNQVKLRIDVPTVPSAKLIHAKNAAIT
jgi:hypothetical protein